MLLDPNRFEYNGLTNMFANHRSCGWSVAKFVLIEYKILTK